MGNSFNDGATATGSSTGITVDQSRRALLQACKVSNESFCDEEVDRAIISAFDHFLSAVPASTDTTDVSLSSGVGSVDLVAAIANFNQNDFLDRCTISNQRVRLAPFEMVERRWAGSTPTAGQPTLIGFREDSYARFDKPTDQAYTLKVTYRRGLRLFTPGSQGTWSASLTYQVGDVVQGDGDPDSLYYRCVAQHTNQQPPASSYWEQVTTAAITPSTFLLNMPPEWAQRVLKTGGVGYLLSGGHIISGGAMHPGAPSAMDRFHQLIEDAKQHFPSTRNLVQDANTPKGT